MKFPFNMVPFQWTCKFSGAGGGFIFSLFALPCLRKNCWTLSIFDVRYFTMYYYYHCLVCDVWYSIAYHWLITNLLVIELPASSRILPPNHEAAKSASVQFFWLVHFVHVAVSKYRGWLKKWKTLLKLMIWGYPYFWKHPCFFWFMFFPSSQDVYHQKFSNVDQRHDLSIRFTLQGWPGRRRFPVFFTCGSCDCLYFWA